MGYLKNTSKCVLGIAVALALISSAPAYARTAAMTAVETIRQNYGQLQDLNVYYDINASVQKGDYCLKNRMEMNMKAENIHAPDQLKLMFYSRMTFLGQEQIYTSYYQDGYAYSDSMGNKIRFPQDVSEASAYIDSLTNLMNPQQELYSHTTLWTEGEETLISFQIAQEQMETVAVPLLTMLQVDQKGREFSVKSISGQYRINSQGYVTKIHIAASMDMTDAGTVQELAIDADIGIDEPGQQIDIQLPDPSEYKTVDS